MKMQSATLFTVLSVAAALFAIIAGLIVIGSPSDVRMRRFDQSRASDLASISRAVAAYRLTHESLPLNLEDIQGSQPSATVNLKDPIGRSYEYAIKDAFSYELCATFDIALESKTENIRSSSIFEKHGVGRQCFSLEARPRAQR
jgi:type II secretory pathway pseudopilin PulG